MKWSRLVLGRRGEAEHLRRRGLVEARRDPAGANRFQQPRGAQAVDLVSLGEEKLGEIRAVLARDTGDECCLGHASREVYGLRDRAGFHQYSACPCDSTSGNRDPCRNASLFSKTGLTANVSLC